MSLYRSFCGCESGRRIVPVTLSSIEDGKSNLTFVPCGGWPLPRKWSRDGVDPWPTGFIRFSLTVTYPDPLRCTRRGRKYSEDYDYSHILLGPDCDILTGSDHYPSWHCYRGLCFVHDVHVLPYRSYTHSHYCGNRFYHSGDCPSGGYGVT